MDTLDAVMTIEGGDADQEQVIVALLDYAATRPKITETRTAIGSRTVSSKGTRHEPLRRRADTPD